MDDVRFTSLGDSAVTLALGKVISAELNDKAIALSERITKFPFPGFIEAVPAYASTTIFYDIAEVKLHFPEFRTSCAAVCSIVRKELNELGSGLETTSRLIEIPVSFDPASGPDLDLVADRSGLDRDAVIGIFISTTYRVYMLGFLPGFSYMGEVDDRIATPRRSTPREKVAKGSVGLAGRQTGIYSLESPGGWQIIGRTNLQMFMPKANPPCLLEPGDHVLFTVADK